MLAAGEQLSSECLYSVSCVVHVLRFLGREHTQRNDVLRGRGYVNVPLFRVCFFFIVVLLRLASPENMNVWGSLVFQFFFVLETKTDFPHQRKCRYICCN